jgi:GntR family transcriptional regulator / MocR family aminotransferase
MFVAFAHTAEPVNKIKIAQSRLRFIQIQSATRMAYFPDPFSIDRMDPFMRKSRGVLLPPVDLRRPRRGDVYRALRNAVLEGVFAPGDRLPSTRQGAVDYGVSRGLMEEVFAQLTEEGFLERAVGRGTFIASVVAGLENRQKPTTRQLRSPGPSRRGSTFAGNAACREPEMPRAFNAGIADTTEFPWKVWCRLHARAARELGSNLLNFADPRGFPELCRAVARYLAQFRGIHCSPRQVMIFNSSQQALNALSLLLLNRGDKVWIEDPCYLGAEAAFDLAGAQIVPVPVDREGMLIEAGIKRASRAGLAYVTPSHQYPTGVTLSLERRIQLLEWATRNGSWVVEDDYDGEFRYSGQPLASLYSLDSQARVLYLATLSKSMFISLRLAYLVVPEELVEPLANIRTQLDGFTPALAQMTMSIFMEEGHFSSHLRRMRFLYGAKRNSLVEGLASMAAQGWTWSENPTGLHLLIRHNRGHYVRAIVDRSDLDLALLSRYRKARTKEDGLFLRFGALSSLDIQEGIEELIDTATKTLDT